MTPRVLVIGSFDSFLRAGNAYGRLLVPEGATLDHALLAVPKRRLSQRQRSQLGLGADLPIESLDDIVRLKRLRQYDLLLLALDGNRTRKFMVRYWNTFRNEVMRPLTISFYPGLIFRFHLEGMTSRMSCDLLLLNSRRDSNLYREALRALRVQHDNSLCVGLPFLNASPRPAQVEKAIVFLGQPTVPVRRIERRFVLLQLLRLAKAFPNTPIRLKPRHLPGESTLHRTRHHYSELLNEISAVQAIPNNFSLSYSTMEKELSQSAVCLTVSSTAALEAIAWGIPTRIVTDFGLNENLGNHFFLGSGLLTDFENISPSLPVAVEAAWLDENVILHSAIKAPLNRKVQSLLNGRGTNSAAPAPPHSRMLGRSVACTQEIFSSLGNDGVAAFSEVLPKRSWANIIMGLRRKVFGYRRLKSIPKAPISPSASSTTAGSSEVL